VTPTSQIVGTQAVLNVLSGARYRQVTQEVKAYLLGKYGRPPGTVDEETRRTVVGDETPILDRPGETIGPELEKLRDDAHRLGIIRQEEDLLTYALYPQVAVRFLRGETKEEAIPEAQSAGAPATVPDLPVEFAVDVDGEVFNVKVGAVIGRTLDVWRSDKGKEEGAEKGNVISPMQGMILYLKVKIGEEVKEGDVVATIEAMKMQTEVRSPHGGVVRQVLVHEGEIVNSGEAIMVVIP